MRDETFTKIVRATWLIICLFATSKVGLAQGVQTSSIVGTIFDTSGGVVPRTEVTIQSPSLVEGALAVPSDASGRFRFAALPPGRYRVSTRLEGFVDAIRGDVDLPLGATLTVDLRLRPAALEVQVTVKEPAAALSTRSDRLAYSGGSGGSGWFLRVVDLKAPESAREILRTTDGLAAFAWSLDDREVIVRRSSQGLPDQLHAIDVRTGTDRGLALSVNIGFQMLRRSPDGRRLSFDAGWPYQEVWALENAIAGLEP